ncbi:MAG: heme ABC transporter ATP-binding protein [Cyclobacteriaceae bacterium]|nr:heme ABC transporter ATP-binding protein [Cyclobacteriaceae bacterium]
MLVASNLTVRVGQKELLKDVSVQFEAGQLNLVIGPNGAGKSTLIKALSGQVKPAAGSIRMHDRPLTEWSLGELARHRAVLSQNIDLAFPLTVQEVVMMGRYPHFQNKPGEKDHLAVQESMHYFDVSELSGRNYLTLSGGEKQRVHFARVAAQLWYQDGDVPRHLLLDEPLTFLDVYHQFQFMHHIRELMGKGNWVVVGVVHDLNLAARFGDNLVLLHNGAVLAQGQPREVLTAHNVSQAYHLTPTVHYHEGVLQLVF